MKKILLLFTLTAYITSIYGQDFDTYLKNKNENYLLPEISPQMSFQDFHLLSQNFRMQDMMAGILVPGIVHFKAQDYPIAWSLVGIRSASYAGLFYEYVKYQQLTVNADTSFFRSLFIDQNSPLSRSDVVITGLSLAGIAGTYLFDMIHGSFVLHKRQEAIRYKYSFKASLASDFSTGNIYGLNLGINLYF